jgi:hypothetical protein
VITAATEMLLISDPAIPAVHAELRYDCDDPFAVQMLLSVDQSPAIRWVFGRDLLDHRRRDTQRGRRYAAVGDVQLYPTHDGLIIELRSGTYAAALARLRPGCRRFRRPDAWLWYRSTRNPTTTTTSTFLLEGMYRPYTDRTPSSCGGETGWRGWWGELLGEGVEGRGDLLFYCTNGQPVYR